MQRSALKLSLRLPPVFSRLQPPKGKSLLHRFTVYPHGIDELTGFSTLQANLLLAEHLIFTEDDDPVCVLIEASQMS
jgi:hypothetical protein